MQIMELKMNLDLAAVFARDSQPERAKGLHVTEIIRWIENHTYHKGERKPTIDLTMSERERMTAYTSVGYAWELIIRTALQKVWCRDHESNSRWITLPEIEKDGISGNVDWFDTQDEAIEEFKATYKSSQHEITTFRAWFMQMKAYAYMLGVRKARLRVFYLMGDYRESGPLIKMWEMEFTPKELADNWHMLVINGQAMLEEERRNGSKRI